MNSNIINSVLSTKTLINHHKKTSSIFLQTSSIFLPVDCEGMTAHFIWIQKELTQPRPLRWSCTLMMPPVLNVASGLLLWLYRKTLNTKCCRASLLTSPGVVLIRATWLLSIFSILYRQVQQHCLVYMTRRWVVTLHFFTNPPRRRLLHLYTVNDAKTLQKRFTFWIVFIHFFQFSLSISNIKRQPHCTWDHVGIFGSSWQSCLPNSFFFLLWKKTPWDCPKLSLTWLFLHPHAGTHKHTHARAHTHTRTDTQIGFLLLKT